MGEHFQSKDETLTYMRNQFTLDVFFDNLTEKPNVIAQVRDSFVSAINGKLILTKVVLIVLDGDLYNLFWHQGFGITHILGSSVMWLTSELHKVVLAHKEKLPKKAKRDTYPTFLWAAAPTHKNFEDNHL